MSRKKPPNGLHPTASENFRILGRNVVASLNRKGGNTPAIVGFGAVDHLATTHSVIACRSRQAYQFRMKFDIIEALRETLHTVPFLPFFVRLHSGEKLRVLHSDFLCVTRSNRIIYDSGKGMRILNPALISSVDVPTGK